MPLRGAQPYEMPLEQMKYTVPLRGTQAYEMPGEILVAVLYSA